MANNLRRCEVCTATLSSLVALEAHKGHHDKLGQLDPYHALTIADDVGEGVFATCDCGWRSLASDDHEEAAECWHYHKLAVAELKQEARDA